MLNTMSNSFGEYLQQKIAQRRRDEGRMWTQNELGRRAGLSSGGISMIVTGKVIPDAKTLKSIAKALNVSPEEVFKAAGMLSVPETELSSEVLELARDIDSLPDNVRSLTIRSLRGVLGAMFAMLEASVGTEVDEGVPLEVLRDLKKNDPELYYQYLEAELGPNWKEIVADVAEMRASFDKAEREDLAN